MHGFRSHGRAGYLIGRTIAPSCTSAILAAIRKRVAIRRRGYCGDIAHVTCCRTGIDNFSDIVAVDKSGATAIPMYAAARLTHS